MVHFKLKIPFLFRKKANKNFIDFPAKEQKDIISKAVRGANERQRALVVQYDLKSKTS